METIATPVTNTPIATRDLAKQAPHSPRTRVAGFVIATRAIDKCRATEAGTPGDYLYDCPLDRLLFGFKGITGAQFKTIAQSAATYEQVGAWLQANGTARTPIEIKTWSDDIETRSPLKNPEKRANFLALCSRLMLNPEMNSNFDVLEAEDRATFRRKLADNTVASDV